MLEDEGRAWGARRARVDRTGKQDGVGRGALLVWRVMLGGGQGNGL